MQLFFLNSKYYIRDVIIHLMHFTDVSGLSVLKLMDMLKRVNVAGFMAVI